MTPEKITTERTVTEGPNRKETRERVYRGYTTLTPRQIVLRKTTRFIWWGTGILEAFIALRVALRMLAANPGNPFASFTYALTDLFLWPFQTLFSNPASDGGAVFEITSLIAMMVYLLLAWVVVEMMWLLLGRERA